MADRESEFLIDGWAPDASGKIHVIGRCGDVPIRVNDRFDAIFRYKHRRFPDELGDDPVREVEIPASLRVDGIRAYERSLDILGQGMTGSIVVSGEGFERISRGWVLGMRNGHQAHPSDGVPSTNGNGEGRHEPIG